MAGLVLGINDRHPDAPALIIGDFVLGGGALSSRLADRIRQKEGLSYQVGSFFSADGVDEVSRLMMMANSNPKNSDSVVIAVREELTRLVKDGITQKELNAAKEGFLQAMKLARTRDGSIVQLLSTTLFEQRTMSYYSALERKIAELTVEQVNTAVRKHFDPKKVVMITAGDVKAGDDAKK